MRAPLNGVFGPCYARPVTVLAGPSHPSSSPVLAAAGRLCTALPRAAGFRPHAEREGRATRRGDALAGDGQAL